jgi:hypothetical protein
MESILGEITRAIRRDKIAAHELLNKSNIPKALLTDFVETLSREKLIELRNALLIALEIED